MHRPSQRLGMRRTVRACAAWLLWRHVVGAHPRQHCKDHEASRLRAGRDRRQPHAFRRSGGTSLGNQIDVVVDPNASYGQSGAGSVHHIAYRAKDDAAQLAWLDEISKHLQVTPVQDRTHFRPIYPRAPAECFSNPRRIPRPGWTNPLRRHRGSPGYRIGLNGYST